MSDCLQPYELYTPWNFPSKNTGVSSYPFSGGSSKHRDWNQVSHIEAGFFTSLTTREAQYV